MEYQNLVKDFAIRTNRNLTTLRYLQAERPDLVIYEVTQLVNSLLGLLIFPQQRYIASIPEIPLGELAAQGWPIPKVIGNFPQAENLRELIRYLRNAIAHFNIEFTIDEYEHLNGLRVWNINRGQTTWKAKISLPEIEQLLDRFIGLILEGDE